MSKITIYGTGYVGLVTGVCLAEIGHEVLCVDVNQEKIKQLKQGIPVIEEIGLEALMHKNQKSGRLTFSDSPLNAVHNSYYHLIAVGTPEGPDGAADLTYVKEVANMLATHRQESYVVINKSTVPVGTAHTLKKMMQAISLNVEFDVISNPEFLREGRAVEDFLYPDRIILGGELHTIQKTSEDLYQHFLDKNVPVLLMDVCSSELTKYASNSMLAMKISFINAMSQLAEKVGADIEVVRQGMALDNRIGPHFITPSCGYGGSCFPKDVKALQAMAREHGANTVLFDAVEEVNLQQMQHFSIKISNYLKNLAGSIANKKVALWGLAFKPETDDTRESPALYIAKALSEQGVKIKAYDPAVSAIRDLEGLEVVVSMEASLHEADALVIATDWEVFKTPDFEVLRKNLKNLAIFDGRNLFDPKEMKAQGFHYVSVGRMPV